MVEDGALSHKIDYVTILTEILNLEGQPNRITGSKVTTILLSGWILPIGGASAVKGLRLQPAQQACSYCILKCTQPLSLTRKCPIRILFCGCLLFKYVLGAYLPYVIYIYLKSPGSNICTMFTNIWITVSVLRRDEGYEVKYNPLTEVVPEGKA